MRAISVLTGISAILLIAGVSLAADPEDIVALYLFDEGGGDVLKDYSGNGHDGTIEGAKWTQGKYGKGLQFDGVNDKVTVPFADDLVLETFTIEAWVKLQSTGSWQSILMRGQNPRNYLLCIHKTGDRVLNSFTSGGKDRWTGTTGKISVTDNQWHHIAATYDGTFAWVYVDGQVDAQQACGKPDKNADPDIIGIGTGSAGAHWLKGVLDELALWKVALTEEEIKETMEGLSKFYLDVRPKGKLAVTWGKLKLIP